MSLFHYRRGVFIPYRSNDWKRRYERLIVIDDSGEIGSESAFCVLTAAVTDDVKRFEGITLAFPKAKSETKHYTSENHEISKVLTWAEECDVDVYAVSYKKSKLDLGTPKKKKDHNLRQTLELVELVLMNDDCKVFDLTIDNTSLMDGYEKKLTDACIEIAGRYGKRIESIEMRDSRGTKILQVQDYIAGAVWAHIEYKEDTENDCHCRFGIIEHKIKQIIRK
ncbi:MAG: DUF3800 domain-containing protein [Methanomassiliicoccaceae archaeon]|nr:DUF3800 domain-containing protein [Methanomassiliicoccaceae archaeon]